MFFWWILSVSPNKADTVKSFCTSSRRNALLECSVNSKKLKRSQGGYLLISLNCKRWDKFFCEKPDLGTNTTWLHFTLIAALKFLSHNRVIVAANYFRKSISRAQHLPSLLERTSNRLSVFEWSKKNMYKDILLPSPCFYAEQHPERWPLTILNLLINRQICWWTV